MSKSCLVKVQIGEVVSKVNNWNPVKDAPNDEITYIDLSAVDNVAKVVTGSQSVAGKDAPSRARQLVKAGDILVSTVRPNLNGVALVPNELDGATASTGFCILRPHSEKIDRSFLFHWVQSSSFVKDMVKKATGASYPAVSDKIIFQSEVPLPSLDEQKRMATILDQADELRRKRQRAIDRLNQLGQAIFQEIFGDPVDITTYRPKVALEDICSINPKRQIKINDLQEVSFLPMAAVSEFGGLNHQELREFREVKKGFTYFERGDVLVAKITPCFENGKASKTDSLVHNYGFGSTEFHVFRPSEQSSASYLFHLLWNRKFRKFAESQMTGSAGQKRVPVSVFKELKVRPPAKDELARFDERINRVEAMQITAARSLEEVNLLFVALQHQAFQGEL